MNPTNSLPLRDIHLPDPVSWWPPAMGWWLLLLLGIVLVWGIFLLVRKLKKPILKKSAKAEIDKVLEEYSRQGDKLVLIQNLSIALRRIGISYLPRNEVAGLSGQEWYNRINQLVRNDRLTDETVQLLSTGPYQKTPELNDDQLQVLIRQVEKWVAALAREKADV